ncbi:MAG: PKD domain-containing protein [Isosphaeraceae bacterium]
MIQYDATGAVASGNLVSGNRIGTDASGTTALPNLYGVFLSRGATGTFVGTNSDGLNDASEGNLIAGNTSFGVTVSQPGSSLNVVAGNTIGLGAGGIPLGNQGGGVFVSLGAQRTRIGTNGDGVSDGIEANVIAHNGSAGVVVFDADTVGTSIRGNVIHHNAGYAIALGPDGLTPNDPLDADLGPNQLQNTPQIDLAVTGPTTRVIGSLRSKPSTTYTIDAYSTPLTDLGQAARWLGSFTLTTDAAGYASLDVTLANATSSTETVTATATDPDGNTSELSSPAPHADAGGPYAVAEGSGVVLDASATTDLDQPPATLLYEWDLDGDGLYGESGPGAERGDEVGISPVFSAAGLNGPSSWVVSLRVVDAVGYTSLALATILVENAPPHVEVGDGAYLVEGGALARVGGFTDPGGDSVSVTVDYGDGSGTLPLTLNPDGTFLLDHPYQEDGAFIVTVTLTDSEGASTSETIDVSVANAGPVVGAIALTSPAFAGRALQFAASFTDPGRLDTHSAEWDWGDGSATSGVVSETSGAGTTIGTHAYTRSGVYLVRLTVTDDDGGAGVSTFLVTISPSVLLLHPTASGALTLSGNASLATSVDVVVNSTSPSAVVASGNAFLDTASLGIAGSYHLGGNATIAGGVTTGIHPVADPLVHLATPSAGPAQDAVDVGGNTVVTIAPGVYPRIVASGNARIVMSPGIYVVKGGGFKVSGNARVEGQEVLIYNAGSSFPAAGGATGPLSFSGNSVVTLSAPTSGLYEGIVMYQARDNTRTVSLSGNASADLDGLIYGPAAPLKVSGNARLSALLIASDLNLTGGAAFGTLTGGRQPAPNHGREIAPETRFQEGSGVLLPFVAGPALGGVFPGVSPDQIDGSDFPSAQTRETPIRGSRVPTDVLVGRIFPRERRFRPVESLARPLP